MALTNASPLPTPMIKPTTSPAEARLLTLWTTILRAHALPDLWRPACSVVAGRYPHHRRDRLATRWTSRDLEAFRADWGHRAEVSAVYEASAHRDPQHWLPAAAMTLRALSIMLDWRVAAGVDGGAVDNVVAHYTRHIINLLRRSSLRDVIPA
jgi:hypothetical protein